MKERIKQQMADSQNKIDLQMDSLIDEISIREQAERYEIFQSAAKDLLLYTLNTTKERTVSECIDWAIDNAWIFADKVIEKMRKEYNVPSKMTDDDIIKEVEERGLIADVLFTNENLVESYGYVKKSETEF